MTQVVKDSPYRWVVVAAGGMMGCVAMGALFALPVLLKPMQAETGWSMTGLSWALTIAFLAMAFASMLWGNLSDRFGARPVVLTGAVLFSASLWLAAHAPSLYVFLLCYGVMAGGAVAAFFAPMMATVMGWFTTQRGLAVSLVSAGMGMAPLTMSPLVAQLIQTHDWRGVLQVLAVIVAVVTIPLSFLMRRPPAMDEAAPVAMMADAPDARMTLRQALTSNQFLVLVATNFFCCATHSGPIVHTVSYAQLCGLSLVAAVSIYSVEGFAGMFGRVGFGVMGDRFGAKRVLATGLFLQSLGAMGYFFAQDLWQFYSVASMFGFIYAGIMPLYAVLIRENFPMKMLGTIMGGTGMAGSLGMATGPVMGGAIFDATGGFGLMYLIRAGMGLFAFLIATTFRPFPKAPEVAGIPAE